MLESPSGSLNGFGNPSIMSLLTGTSKNSLLLTGSLRLKVIMTGKLTPANLKSFSMSHLEAS